jgi:Asp-tRNA(Asn)/Glu-tRNA(Gln) amidotransferase A subunit family amidase
MTPIKITANDLCQLDALELSATIHRRDASCREVMQAFLGRIGKLNAQANAIVSMRDEAGLLTQADARDGVLIAGKGHEASQEIKGQRLPFSDAQQAQACLDAGVWA